MRRALPALLLSGASLLATFQAPAQQQPGPSTPNEMMVAPSAPPTVPDASTTSTHSPANICQELVTYLQQNASAPPAQPESAAGPGQSAPPMDRAQQTSGQSAPIPNSSSNAPAPQMGVDEAQALAGSNDLRGCQKAAQDMRRAGAVMPPGLMALAALREDLLLQAPPPSGAQDR